LRLPIPVTGVAGVGGVVYVAVSSEASCKVSVLRGNDLDEVVTLQSSPCLIPWGSREGLLVSSGNTLYLVSDGEARPVLRARPGNWFWHGVEAQDGVFLQEYGEPPTGIYVSEDLVGFRRVTSNKDVDPLSRHFHYVAFDERAGLLVVTLGDGNVVRVAASQDHGSSWKPLYKGPWQFVPVLVDGDRWVLGFDSGIARGGVAVYDVERGDWSFTFLKARGYRYAQFTCLTRFLDYYVGCLGLPTAIIVSRDLEYWYPLYIESTSTPIVGYNHFVNAIVWGERIVAVTGRELLVFDYSDVERALGGEPLLTPYKAYVDRVRGVLYVARRLPWMLRL
jgi:hypothetical protein